MGPPLIVTAALDPASRDYLDALRAAHFPPEHNVLSAHLTLLHAVPAARADVLHGALADAAAATAPVPLTLRGLRGLGRGVAVQVHAPGLMAVHARLQRALAPWLTAQDRQRLWPHVTVANRLTREAARRLLAELRAGFAARDGTVTGLQSWHYLGGPWEPDRQVALIGEPPRARWQGARP